MLGEDRRGDVRKEKGREGNFVEKKEKMRQNSRGHRGREELIRVIE